MSLTDLLSLVQSKHWLGLIAFAVLMVRKWTGPDSKFPVTIPATWAPTVTAAGGLAYGLVSALQTGQSLGMAALSMALAAGTGGFLDGMLVAIFNHDNAPVWARTLVFIFDDLTGGSAKPHTAAADRVLRSVRPGALTPPTGVVIGSKPPPPAASRGKVGFTMKPLMFILTLLIALPTAGLIAATTACTGKPIVVPPNAPTDVENAISCVTGALLSGGDLTACITQYGPALVADALQILIHSTFGKEHPELLPKMQAKLVAMKAAP
jgi:hypothetical protein